MVNNSENGYILILVLIMILLLSSLVLLFGYESRIELNLTGNFKDETKAYYLARSGLNLAAWVLDEDDPKTDSFNDTWALPVFPLPIPEGVINWDIIDESGKLSLARLCRETDNGCDEEYFQVISRLFEILGYNTNILDALLDWLDPDDIPRGYYGAESNYYGALKPPYNPRNGNMESNFELFMIRGFSGKVVFGSRKGEQELGFPDGLINYVTVYPTDAVNLNTAPLPVLMALNDRLDRFEAERIIFERTERDFKNNSDIDNLEISESYKDILKQYGGFNSSYFTVKVQGEIGKSRKMLTGVYRRVKGNCELAYFREGA